jgi:radical SAM/Cys-rich protein
MSVSSRTPSLSGEVQRQLLAAALPKPHSFEEALPQRGLAIPQRQGLRVLQLNLGKLCNMHCSHCHVDAGPHQGHTQMALPVVEACIAAMQRLRPAVVDLTGGAPELHPEFRRLVRTARQLGCHVIDRCNLTVLLLPSLADLAGFLAAQQVEVVASLPQPEAGATDAQRGEGTWQASIQALRLLNQLGYGQGRPERQLTLMSNPGGTSLQQLTPCDAMAWKRRLQEQEGVSFDRLIGLNNMPIARFLEQLHGDGAVNGYLTRLQGAFNPAALEGLMCRDTLSVAADGSLHDCDFNQMLELPLERVAGEDSNPSIATIRAEQLNGRAIRWGNHCYGCTAGQGSSCSGATSH